MLAIRLQRTGRKGHAQFRFVVQDSRQSPKSGRVVAQLGSYNPHTKVAEFDKEQAATYVKNGAQPSDKVALIFKKEGVKLPDWVTVAAENKREIRNPEKLRRNRPAEAAEPKEEQAVEPEAVTETAEEPQEEASATETPAEEPAATEEPSEPAPEA